MFLSSSATSTLTISSPTATTVSFTVSTRRSRTTLAAQILRWLAIVARIVLGLFILGLWWAKWEESGPLARVAAQRRLDGVVSPWTVTLLSVARDVVRECQWRWLIPASMIGLWVVIRRGYTEESLLVLRGLGIQTTTSAPTYFALNTTRFIPTSAIQDIFIHEAFKGFEVKFYLCIVVAGEEDVVVVFPNLLPKRTILEEVWRDTRACLYEPNIKS